MTRTDYFTISAGGWLVDRGSDLRAAFTEMSEWIGENLADPWTASVLGMFLFFAATLAWLTRPGTPRQQRAGSKLMIPLLALMIATFGGGTLRWSLALPGTWLAGVGVLTIWGGEINERLIAQRRVARIWLPHWTTIFTNTRNSANLGLLSVVLGLAMVAGGAFHAVSLLLVSLPILRRVTRSEVRLLKSGEASNFSPAIWSSSVSVVVLAGLAFAVLTGLLVDRHFSWIDVSSPSSEGPLVLQALLAVEVGVASLSAAAIGLAVQLRSSAFGSDIAFSQLSRNRLVASFVILLTTTVATIFVLGNWNDLKGPLSGLLPSLVVQAALAAAAWVVFEATTTVMNLASVRNVSKSVGNLALANDWQEQLRTFGWNAHRPGFGPIRGFRLPRSVHLLIQAIQGAVRTGDLGLLQDIVSDWSDNAATQPAVAQFRGYARTADALEQALFDKELDWKDASTLDGLDIALAYVVQNASAIPGAGRVYVRTLLPLAQLTYPPFSKDVKYHDVRGYYNEIPGFRTLDELIQTAAHIDDAEAVRWLLVEYWPTRVRLAIHWAERITPDDEKNGTFPRLPVAEHLFDMLAGYAKIWSTDSRKTVRGEVIQVLVQAVSVAESSAAITEGLHKVYEVVDYDDDTIWFHWQDLKRIAEKPRADTAWLGAILDRSVAVSLDGRESIVSFGLHSFIEFCAALSLAIEEHADRDAEGARSASDEEERLAMAVWKLTLWAIERSDAQDAKLRFRFQKWSLREKLQDFVSNCSLSVAWKVVDEIWDWAAVLPAERDWLARAVDGPWLRRT